MPILFMHNNDNQQSHSESRVKKILSHVPSSVLSHRIGFSKSSSSSSVSSTTSDKLPQLSSRSTASNSSNESKEVLNEDGFAEPKKFLYPKAKIQEMLAWRSPQGPGAGLHNHGNTCFLNSVVQCITHTPPLANYLLSKEHSRSCKTVGFCMMCILEKHVARATSTGGAISPQEIVQNLRKIAPGFRPGRQEDAHEFLRFVIEGAQKSCLVHLQKEKVPPREAQTTVIGNIFGGYLQSQVKCSECSYESNTYDPFMDLSVELGDHVETLSAALHKFIKPETLDAKNMYMCSKCKKRVRAQKRMRIYQAPPVLTIQLKRFSFFQMFGGKINRPIKFESRLTLDPFMTKPSPNGPIVYSLYGVLVHLGGSTNSGHYYSFVKAANGEWYKMDDSSVSKETLGNVLQQRAYILFYVRTGDSSRTPTPNRTSNSAHTTPNHSTPSTPSSSTPSSSTPPSSAPSTPTTPASPANRLNGHTWNPNTKTYSPDSKEKTPTKPSLMSKLYQQQTSTSQPANSQQSQQKQSQQQKQQPSQPQQQQQPGTSPHLKQPIPRALRLQQAQKRAAAPLPSHSPVNPPSLPPSATNPPQPSDAQSSPPSHLSQNPPHEHPSPLAQNGHLPANGKRKQIESNISPPSSPPLGSSKKPRIEHDPSVLSIGGMWSVRDVVKEKASTKEDKGQEKEKIEERNKGNEKEEKVKGHEANGVTEGSVEERRSLKREKKKAKKAAKKAEKEQEKEKEKEIAKEAPKDKDIWKNLFDEVPTHAAEITTTPKNGKVKPAENGKHPEENGKRSENGKLQNGNHHVAENGKPKPTENGKHSAENGKRTENGKHVSQNGNATPTENGKHSENGKKSGFSGLKFNVKHGAPSPSASERANDFLKRMEAIRDGQNIFGTNASTWDDNESEQTAKARKRDLEKQEANNKVERMFTERDEWDIEYDMGKQKKVKTGDLFDNKQNLFQTFAEQSIITK